MTMRTEPARARATSDPVDASAPSVLAIVVTHNGRTWFKDALVGLNTQTYPLVDILVVDDILDSGGTLRLVVPRLKELGAASVKACVPGTSAQKTSSTRSLHSTDWTTQRLRSYFFSLTWYRSKC